MFKRRGSPEFLLYEHQQRLRSMGRFLYCMLKQSLDVEKNLKQGKLYANLFKQYFPESEDRQFLREVLLTAKQWEDLKRLIEIVKTGKIETDFIDASIKDTKSIHNQKLSEYEKQMTAKMIANPEPLKKLLGFETIVDKTTEMIMAEFGKCDLVIRTDSELYVIEVKDETADHKVVGQIMKYINGGILLMKSSAYQWVNGVVVAPGYTSDALVALRSINVKPLMFMSNGSDYSLELA